MILTRVVANSFVFVQSIRMDPPEYFRKDKIKCKSKMTEKVYNNVLAAYYQLEIKTKLAAYYQK